MVAGEEGVLVVAVDAGVSVVAPPADASVAAGADVASLSAISKGISAGGAGGGVGIVPLTLFCCDKTETGTSTIFVAVTTIPFLRPNASTICPFTLNF